MTRRPPDRIPTDPNLDGQHLIGGGGGRALQREVEDHREVEADPKGVELHQEIEDHYEEVGQDPSFLALDRDEDDEVTPNDVFIHVHTKDHDGVTFIDNRSTRFHAKLMRRREEHTQATPDRPIDEKQLYYDAKSAQRGVFMGSGHLPRGREDMKIAVPSQLGMRMDFGASTFQAPPPLPPPPPPQEHHQQVGMDPARSPQQ
ncbi:hypothetical protein Scep_029639 [Stephania cephalantha]|uniref:Uncharacterized protein n=1 Tax=Stephania cephalantha TaxID=152367 RepID=A0AAP0E5T9_9MAGN